MESKVAGMRSTAETTETVAETRDPETFYFEDGVTEAPETEAPIGYAPVYSIQDQEIEEAAEEKAAAEKAAAEKARKAAAAARKKRRSGKIGTKFIPEQYGNSIRDAHPVPSPDTPGTKNNRQKTKK